jgi:hypothetical protein
MGQAHARLAVDPGSGVVGTTKRPRNGDAQCPGTTPTAMPREDGSDQDRCA